MLIASLFAPHVIYKGDQLEQGLAIPQGDQDLPNPTHTSQGKCFGVKSIDEAPAEQDFSMQW